jgi:hypothetical protein
MSQVKPFTRIVTDGAGGSVFEDDEFALDAPVAVVGMHAGAIPAASAAAYGVVDMSVGDPDPAPHPAPQKQWVVVLLGVMEVEVTDGSRRTFRAGDLIRVEDTKGTGHITRLVGDPRFEALTLPG